MIGIAWDPVPDTSTYVKRQQQFELWRFKCSIDKKGKPDEWSKAQPINKRALGEYICKMIYLNLNLIIF